MRNISFYAMESPESNEDIAKQFILKEINNVSTNSSIIKENGCSACHILFNLMDNMQISESDASDLLSQVLSDDPKLNDRFIEMVEKIHMKQRMMGIPFSIKTREAKDKYIASNFKNLLAELSSDLINYGTDIVLRKLLASSIALQLAQNIGIDYHAATEELYYYMRNNDQQTNESILDFINNFYSRVYKKD
jgi:hypothetical protein